MNLLALRGSAWIALRLHRTALWTGLALAAASAVLLGGLRSWVNSVGGGQDCESDGSVACSGYDSAYQWFSNTSLVDSKVLLFLPLLLGAFVAGPVIGRELESRTHLLAWSQSVSPTLWLTAKLGVAALLTSAVTLAFMGAFRLSSFKDPYNEVLQWSDRGVYEATGPALVAYGLLAVAVGALAGLMVRRVVPAMALSGAVTGAVLFGLSSVRWSLLPVQTFTVKETSKEPSTLSIAPPVRDVFITESGVENAAGQRFQPEECLPKPQPGFHCPADNAPVRAYADYHPRSHFWYIQFMETGIVLALAALAAYAAFRVLRRRTA
ncbi:ABC transporter permease [Actinomycetota bacterium Odt1-20B]